MAEESNKPKLRCRQFSLRKFILLATLFSVLAVAGWRYREWGRELHDRRHDRRMANASRTVDDLLKLMEFDREYWLPMKVYELTSRPPRQPQRPRFIMENQIDPTELLLNDDGSSK